MPWRSLNQSMPRFLVREVGGIDRLRLEFRPRASLSTADREDRDLPGKVTGKIVAISDAGNLITDIVASQLADAPRDERLTVACDEHVTQGLFDANHQEPPMTLLALVGPQGQLELCIVGDSAAIMLGVRPGEKVVVEWA